MADEKDTKKVKEVGTTTLDASKEYTIKGTGTSAHIKKDVVYSGVGASSAEIAINHGYATIVEDKK